MCALALVRATLDQLIDFRRWVIAQPGMFAADVVFLRGCQEEMWQSLNIIRQAIDKLPEGPFFSPNVPDFYLPPKEEVYNNMEALIYHFKIVMGETDVPKGEVYHCVEGGNGELGFYLISDGGRTPFRLHFRRPCFIYYQAYAEMIKGANISDAILTMSSMNVIAGELDA